MALIQIRQGATYKGWSVMLAEFRLEKEVPIAELAACFLTGVQRFCGTYATIEYIKDTKSKIKVVRNMESTALDIYELYPLNLGVNILGEKNKGKIYLKGIEDAVLALPPLESLIITLRFKELLTFVEIHSCMTITMERIKQLEAKGLRILRNPSTLGKITAMSLEEHRQKNIEKKPIIVEPTIDKEIEYLELSIKSLNCLRRGGYKTIADIINLTEVDLINVRNLGKKGTAEILDRLQIYKTNTAN